MYLEDLLWKLVMVYWLKYTNRPILILLAISVRIFFLLDIQVRNAHLLAVHGLVIFQSLEFGKMAKSHRMMTIIRGNKRDLRSTYLER